MSPLEVLGKALWFILPAYVANATPVVFGGGTPLDMGRKFIDGRRIFGDGKTVRGLIAGLVAGILVGSLQWFTTDPFQVWHGGPLYALCESFRGFYLSISISNASGMVLLSFLLASGALLGDLIGSFIKRRFNLKRGSFVPGLDQLGFLVVALALASLASMPGLPIVITLLIATLPIHLGTNFLAYKLGLKSRPW